MKMAEVKFKTEKGYKKDEDTISWNNYEGFLPE